MSKRIADKVRGPTAGQDADLLYKKAHEALNAQYGDARAFAVLAEGAIDVLRMIESDLRKSLKSAVERKIATMNGRPGRLARGYLKRHPESPWDTMLFENTLGGFVTFVEVAARRIQLLDSSFFRKLADFLDDASPGALPVGNEVLAEVFALASRLSPEARQRVTVTRLKAYLDGHLKGRGNVSERTLKRYAKAAGLGAGRRGRPRTSQGQV